MSQEQQQAGLNLLLASRLGSGFIHDLHHCGDLKCITAPTLVIASKHDGFVDLSHENYAADHITIAELFVSLGESQLMWFSSYNVTIEEKMQTFLQVPEAR
jgi:hypothetical protein